MTADDEEAGSSGHLEGEQLLVWRYRYQQDRHAGLIPDDAMEFAHSDADVEQLRKLVASGVEPEMIARIVL